MDDQGHSQGPLEELLSGLATLIGATAVLLLVLFPSLLLIAMARAWGYLSDTAFAPASVLAALCALAVAGSAVYRGRFEPRPRRPYERRRP